MANPEILEKENNSVAEKQNLRKILSGIKRDRWNISKKS